MFLRKPKFAFLEEATSAFDEDNQGHLYQLIRESGTGYISVGYCTTRVPYHDWQLMLDRDGT